MIVLIVVALLVAALCQWIAAEPQRQAALARVLVRVAGLIHSARRHEFDAELRFLQSDPCNATGLGYARGVLLAAATESATHRPRLLAETNPIAMLASASGGAYLPVPGGSIVGLVGRRSTIRSTITSVWSTTFAVDSDTGYVSVPDSQTDHNLQVKRLPDPLVGQLTIWENFAVTPAGERRRWIVDPQRQRRLARAALDRVGLTHLDPNERVRDLGRGDRTLVALATALHRRDSVVVVDDSNLSDPNRQRLADALCQLRAEGIGVVLISQDVAEVCRIADRVAVLREGLVTLDVDTSRLSPEDLVHELASGS